MSDMKDHRRRRAWLMVLSAMAVTTAGAFVVHANTAQDAARGEEGPRAFPNSDFNASIVHLLAHPDKHHGQRVLLRGYLHVEFEDTAIYLSQDDGDYGITANGFWVSFDESKIPFEGKIGPREFDRKYVLLEGTFNARRRGHLGGWQGSVEKVSRVQELRKSG